MNAVRAVRAATCDDGAGAAARQPRVSVRVTKLVGADLARNPIRFFGARLSASTGVVAPRARRSAPRHIGIPRARSHAASPHASFRVNPRLDAPRDFSRRDETSRMSPSSSPGASTPWMLDVACGMTAGVAYVVRRAPFRHRQSRPAISSEQRARAERCSPPRAPSRAAPPAARPLQGPERAARGLLPRVWHQLQRLQPGASVARRQRPVGGHASRRQASLLRVVRGGRLRRARRTPPQRRRRPHRPHQVPRPRRPVRGTTRSRRRHLPQGRRERIHQGGARHPRARDTRKRHLLRHLRARPVCLSAMDASARGRRRNG